MMASEESLTTLKILMIGPSGAGKSACTFVHIPYMQTQCANSIFLIVLIRYCDDQFDSESSTATIGVDFKVTQQTLCYSVLMDSNKCPAEKTFGAWEGIPVELTRYGRTGAVSNTLEQLLSWRTWGYTRV
jgi:hypothetical protein